MLRGIPGFLKMVVISYGSIKPPVPVGADANKGSKKALSSPVTLLKGIPSK